MRFKDKIIGLADVSRGFFRWKNKLKKPQKLAQENPSCSAYHYKGLEEILELVGGNWGEAIGKPIAIMVGFNPWKRQFISDYLPEYRTAFIRGKTSWYRIKAVLDEFEGLCFVVWGMTESEEIRRYADQKKYPIYRMEDGFIRSVELGSEHTHPLSIVLDKKGIYFDATKSSDLEDILNNYNFNPKSKLMTSAKALIDVIKSVGISKYNLGDYKKFQHILGPKIKKRILVLGQVEGDASIQFGYAGGWTDVELIKLAQREHLNAEIIYKPHPDVLKGYRKNSSALKEIQKITTVVVEEVILADLFAEIDHVYTITSLSGFEALLHGKKVTVVGAPFYSGWGLTDDRLYIDRRNRKLSLEELFCGAYLIYPRYSVQIGGHAVENCLATILTICAQKTQKINLLAQKEVDFNELSKTNYWPLLLTQPAGQYVKNLKSKGVCPFDHQVILRKSGHEFYLTTVIFLLIGQYRTSASLITKLLTDAHRNMPINCYGDLLFLLWRIHPVRKIIPAREVLARCAFYYESIGEMKYAEDILKHLSGSDEADLEKAEMSKSQLEAIFGLANFKLRQRELDEAVILFYTCLVYGYKVVDTLYSLSEIAYLRFDFGSSMELFWIVSCLNIKYKETTELLTKSAGLSGEIGACFKFLSLVPIYSSVDKTVEIACFVSNLLERHHGISLPMLESSLVSVNNICHADILKKARSFLHLDKLDKAQELLEYAPNKVIYLSTRVDVHIYLNEHKKAKEIVCGLLNYDPYRTSIYNIALRVACFGGDYEFGMYVLNLADKYSINVSELWKMRVFCGLRMLDPGMLGWRQKRFGVILKRYFQNKYQKSLVDIPLEATLAVLSYPGPGDEFRFASIYPEIVKARHGGGKVVISCDERLYELFHRSFPGIDFVPVKRVRDLSFLDKDNYSIDYLPTSEMVEEILDDKLYKISLDADYVSMVPDLLPDFIKSYSSFSGNGFLCFNEERALFFKDKLKGISNAPLVGICWRSSIQRRARNHHFLTIQELSPVLEIEGIQFVNLQYDECSDELSWAELNYPGKLIDVAGLDQYNDFDGVAALMSCLDLVISVGSAPVELAGACGFPTWLLSNSPDFQYRKISKEGTDCWFKSINHIESSPFGDKVSLVNNLKESLLKRYLRDGKLIAGGAGNVSIV